jgi:hypothetical protein
MPNPVAVQPRKALFNLTDRSVLPKIAISNLLSQPVCESLNLATGCLPLAHILMCGTRERLSPTLMDWDAPTRSELLEDLQDPVKLLIVEFQAGRPADA